jgi:hypothetical protein
MVGLYDMSRSSKLYLFWKKWFILVLKNGRTMSHQQRVGAGARKRVATLEVEDHWSYHKRIGSSVLHEVVIPHDHW